MVFGKREWTRRGTALFLADNLGCLDKTAVFSSVLPHFCVLIGTYKRGSNVLNCSHMLQNIIPTCHTLVGLSLIIYTKTSAICSQILFFT